MLRRAMTRRMRIGSGTALDLSAVIAESSEYALASWS
jgi:hypothetical protein